MAITLAAGNGAKIGIKPNVVGKLYGTGYLYLTEMSAESSLEFSNSVTTQEVYGTTTAKNIGGTDEASFSFTAFVAATTGMVYAYSVTTAGTGYTAAPTVGLTGGAGTGATAISEVDVAAGTITGVWPTAFGEGYTSAPTVSFTGGGGASAAATAAFGGLTDKVLYDMLKAQYLKIEFSPNGGTASSKKTRYTFDFTRESFSISPAVNGVITIQASGKVENITQDVW